MSENLKITLFIVSCLLGVLILTGGAVMIERHIEFHEASAEIEQLKADSEEISSNSEDVVGQITQYNQTIKRMQARNQIFFIQMWVPNGWDDVELIKVPESSK